MSSMILETGFVCKFQFHPKKCQTKNGHIVLNAGNKISKAMKKLFHFDGLFSSFESSRVVILLISRCYSSEIQLYSAIGAHVMGN